MKKIIFLIIGLPFIIINCKDDPKPTILLSQSIKDYCRFKDSSWWVYKNQFGQEDSNYIFAYIEGFVDSKRNSKIYERIEYRISTSYYLDTFIFLIENGFVTNGKPISTSIPGMYYGDMKDTSKVQLFDFEYIQLIDTLEEYNGFKKIKIFKVSATSDIFNPLVIYYSKNIGIIRKEMIDGTIWQLKKYRVLQ